MESNNIKEFHFEVFDLQEDCYKVYLDAKSIDELKKLIDSCKILVNNPELVTASPAVTDKYLIQLSAWLFFISKINADATIDLIVKKADIYKEYKHKQFDARVKKPEFKKLTDATCEQYVNADLGQEMRNAEVFKNLYHSLRELVQSLRAIVRARELTKYEKSL